MSQISLAQTINARLAPSSTAAAAAAGATTAEERQAVSLASTSLQSLGLVSAAVTADLVSDSKRYHEELAKELAEVLRKGGIMERQGGIVGLDEVWCLWNRARGVGASFGQFDFRSRAGALTEIVVAARGPFLQRSSRRKISASRHPTSLTTPSRTPPPSAYGSSLPVSRSCTLHTSHSRPSRRGSSNCST